MKGLQQPFDELGRRSQDVDDDDVVQSLHPLAHRRRQRRLDFDVLRLHPAVDNLVATDAAEPDQPFPERHLFGLPVAQSGEFVRREGVGDQRGVAALFE